MIIQVDTNSDLKFWIVIQKFSIQHEIHSFYLISCSTNEFYSNQISSLIPSNTQQEVDLPQRHIQAFERNMCITQHTAIKYYVSIQW